MKLSRLASAAALGLAIMGGRANASVIIDVSQVGDNVVTTGSGAIDLNDLTFVQTQTLPSPGAVFPSVGGVLVGGVAGQVFDLYRDLSGPASFGPGSLALPDSGSGDGFGVNGSGFGVPSIYLPTGYVSGTALSGSSTYNGQTLASLGLTPGTYLYTWGRDGDADSLTVEIEAVPEPATWAMMMLGFAGLGLAGYRARKSPALAG